jgi:hypothetical protein
MRAVVYYTSNFASSILGEYTPLFYGHKEAGVSRREMEENAPREI